MKNNWSKIVMRGSQNRAYDLKIYYVQYLRTRT